MPNDLIKREMLEVKEEIANEDFENEPKEFNCETFNLDENENKCIKQERGDKPRKKPAKELFHCELCRKSFNRKFNLEVHMRVHTGDKPFVCEICQKAFATNSTLNTHKVTHLDGKQYKCGICDKSYSLKNTLKYHLNKMHVMQFTCDICNGHYSTRNELDHHLQMMHSKLNSKQNVEVPVVLTQENKLLCKICNKKCASQRVFDAHMRIHTGEKPFNCFKCDKSFTTNKNLDNHTKSFHSNENSLTFPCPICDSTYNVKTNLKIHMRIHTGENLNKCDKCPYVCPLKSVFETHVRTHTGEKPFECNECEFKAVSKQQLKRHITCSFTEPFNFCEICNVNFRYKCAYKNHNKIHDR